MAAFWKAAAVVVLAVILGVSLGKTEKDFSVILSVCACCLVLMTAMDYLSEVMNFLRGLGGSGNFGNAFLDPLLKIAGVALMTEITALISSDAGNASLGKAMQILGNAVILVLSLPMMDTFLTTIQEILMMV